MREKAEAEQKLISEQWLAHAGTRVHLSTRRNTPLPRPDSITCESKDWRDASEFIAMVLQVSDPSVDADTLAKIAAEILSEADEMDGPMPADITAFVARYGRPAV